MKQKRKLRIFISNTAFPARDPDDPSPVGGQSTQGHPPGADPATASWELRVEGR